MHAVGPLVGLVARRDAALGRQLRWAAAAIVLDIAEGAKRRGADRLQHDRIASGSAAEVTAALEVAVAFGYLDHAATTDAQSLLDRVRALLYRQR